MIRQRKIPFSLIMSFVLLLACAVSAIWLIQQQRSADRWIRHTLEVENRLASVQVLTTRAEISRRGFLLTGSPQDRTTFVATRRALAAPLGGLIGAVQDNAPQARRARALRMVILAKLVEMQSSMAIYAGGDRAAAAALIACAPSRVRTRQLLGLIDAMRSDEERLLTARSARSSRLQRAATAALGVSALLLLLLALVVVRELRRRLAAVTDANTALERDIIARTALERELETALARTEAAGKAKTNFLADMSHEIRTPMNGVIGFTDLLLAGDLNADQRRQAEMIADSGQAMMRLLNDILDLSKVEAGQMTIASEAFDLPHALKACTKLMVPVIEQRGLSFHCDFADDIPRLVLGDGLRLRQIILNLLGNAAKFTQAGEIRLRARTVDRAGRPTIEIDVEDTGIGIALDHQDAVFDHFVQADAAIAPRFGGTGLGLSISRQLARLMGGDLVLRSETGGGSCFTLTVPLVLAVTETTALPDVVVPAAADAPLARAGKPIRVLVAEDHDVNQMLMMETLAQLGIRADLAEDGGRAIEMIVAASPTDPFSLVLMDMQMPGIDGCEATLRLRAMGIGPDRLPIIALTANAYADDIADCLNAGMQAHLSKPVKASDLEASIRRWAVDPDPPSARPEGAERFSPQLRNLYQKRRTELVAMVQSLAEADQISDADIARVSDVLHKVAGSAGMFGDAELGRTARALEELLGTCARRDRRYHTQVAADAMRTAA